MFPFEKLLESAQLGLFAVADVLSANYGKASNKVK